MANASFRNLLLLIQKRFLKTSATLSPTSPPPPPSPSLSSPSSSSSSSSFTVQYLMSSFGLSLKSALAASRKFQVDQKKLNHVLEFLKSHGFDNAQIPKLVEKYPAILRSKVESNLKPKFDFLNKEGFVGPLLWELIVSNPLILKRGLDYIKPSFEFLKQFLESNEKIVGAVKGSSWLINFNLKGTMKPNVDILIKEGVPISTITKLMATQPRTLMHKPCRMVYAVKAVKDLGLEPESPMFIRGIKTMLSLSESSWKKKVDVFKSMGWTEEQILLAFKKEPLCLATSEEKIRILMDFYVNTMKVDPAIIMSCPKFLMYGFDRRVRPRYNVLKVLEEKKLLKLNKGSAWALGHTEKVFMENYVTKYLDKVPNLLEIYGCAAKTKM